VWAGVSAINIRIDGENDTYKMFLSPLLLGSLVNRGLVNIANRQFMIPVNDSLRSGPTLLEGVARRRVVSQSKVDHHRFKTLGC
jgi:hypothetical protein